MSNSKYIAGGSSSSVMIRGMDRIRSIDDDHQKNQYFAGEEKPERLDEQCADHEGQPYEKGAAHVPRLQ